MSDAGTVWDLPDGIVSGEATKNPGIYSAGVEIVR